MEMKLLFVLVALFVYCGHTSAMLEPRDEVRAQLEPWKVRLTEQRLHDDIRAELRDVTELERQLAHSLDMIHTRKRQLEIKRSGIRP